MIWSLQYQERDTLYDQTYVETWKLYLNICLLYKISDLILDLVYPFLFWIPLIFWKGFPKDFCGCRDLCSFSQNMCSLALLSTQVLALLSTEVDCVPGLMWTFQFISKSVKWVWDMDSLPATVLPHHLRGKSSSWMSMKTWILEQILARPLSSSEGLVCNNLQTYQRQHLWQ